MPDFNCIFGAAECVSTDLSPTVQGLSTQMTLTEKSAASAQDWKCKGSNSEQIRYDSLSARFL